MSSGAPAAGPLGGTGTVGELLGVGVGLADSVTEGLGAAELCDGLVECLTGGAEECGDAVGARLA